MVQIMVLGIELYGGDAELLKWITEDLRFRHDRA
jgi:hypothetical protein